MNQATNTSNLTIAWCDTILDTLISAGVKRVFFSPGYRDAPFAAALRSKNVEIVSLIR